MSIAAAPARPLTIEEWYELYHDHEGGHCELVRGRAIMTPTEANANHRAMHRLTRLIGPCVDPPWQLLTGPSVRLGADPTATIRQPDGVLLHTRAASARWLNEASDVALVVEVVSPSSVETDWVTKRGEYAAAGIPAYLIVDVRFPDGPRLWLFDRLSPTEGDGGGEPTTYPRYADPTGDGTTVTLRLPGFDPITITAADLI